MNNIVITGSFLFPTGIAASARLRNLALGFTEAGANVFIIASSPPLGENDYPIGEWIEFTDNVNLIFTSDNKMTYGNIRLRKRVIFFEAVRKTSDILEKLLQKENIDCVFLYGRSYLLFNRVLNVTETHNVSTILDVVELPTLELGLREYFVHPFTIDSYLSFKKIAKRIDIIAFITTALEQLYKHTASVKYLLPSIEEWGAYSDNNPINEVFTFAYVGALLEKDAPEKLFDFVQLLDERGINFKIRIIGRFEQSAEGRKWMEKFKVDDSINKHLIWIGEISDENLSRILKSSDGLILLRQDRKIEEYSFPTRLVEYLKTANPVFVTAKGDIPLYLKHMKSACLLSHDLSNSLDDIIRIINEKHLSRSIGKAGFEAGKKHFNRKDHTSNLIELVKQSKEKALPV